MRALCAEFPNDNPDLHLGAIWQQATPTSPSEPEIRDIELADAVWLSEQTAPPAEAVPSDTEPQPVACEPAPAERPVPIESMIVLAAPPEPDADFPEEIVIEELDFDMSTAELEGTVRPPAVHSLESSAPEPAPTTAPDSSIGDAPNKQELVGVARSPSDTSPNEQELVGVWGSGSGRSPHGVWGGRAEAEPEPGAPAFDRSGAGGRSDSGARSPSEPEDTYAALVATLREVAEAEGGAADAVSAVLEGPEAVAAAAWRAVLRGEVDDISTCGSAMLDEWAADVLAQAIAAPGKAAQLRRELRARGVCAFGLIAA